LVHTGVAVALGAAFAGLTAGLVVPETALEAEGALGVSVTPMSLGSSSCGSVGFHAVVVWQVWHSSGKLE
jgi:hypothetical protein